MTTIKETVSAAKTPLEALTAIAGALDDLLAAERSRPDPQQSDGWGADWGGRPVEITKQGDSATVVLPPADAERKSKRLVFARDVLDLETALGDDEAWADVYALGGPMWLYLAQRDLVMSYPQQVKQEMIADVEQDSPQDAHEMARDILKVPTDEIPRVSL